MTPEDLQKIEELYHAAREHSPGERESFLAEMSNGDEALLKEVSSLLAQDVDKGPMERPMLSVAAGVLDHEKRKWAPGTTVGPFEIVKLLGTGGMGSVYQARDA